MKKSTLIFLKIWCKMAKSILHQIWTNLHFFFGHCWFFSFYLFCFCIELPKLCKTFLNRFVDVYSIYILINYNFDKKNKKLSEKTNFEKKSFQRRVLFYRVFSLLWDIWSFEVLFNKKKMFFFIFFQFFKSLWGLRVRSKIICL